MVLADKICSDKSASFNKDCLKDQIDLDDTREPLGI